MSSLVIAAHGTRLAEGQQVCRALVDRVRGMLPETKVYDAYVELDTPTIEDAVATALAESADKHVVVVPLMIGAGGHVHDDIPGGIEAGRAKAGVGAVSYAGHLGPDPLLRAAARDRIADALGDWTADETSVVFLGRGCSVPEANADHVRLGRLLREEGGYADVVTGFIQISDPDLTTALDRAYAHGGRKVVVMPHYLFPGLLQKWAKEQSAAWQQNHPDAEVRVSELIGDCDALAQMVVDRFRAVSDGWVGPATGPAPQVYLSGLVLTGHKVLIVGAGTVAGRRIGNLLEAGADVQVVAPDAGEKITALATEGKVAWAPRAVSEDDLDGAWYVLALTDAPEVNAQVAAWAEARRVFCVRGDDATGGTAWTPATGEVAGLKVGVVGDRNPHRTAHARSAAVKALGELAQ
ncbi:CbiX/SirB N-terminal domain-containing protein [Propionimicrobium sp. PCR01-08-3]|uniref:CbiX/SirB N-terminal domain-containing protein n=1 Tax=Propionimicrobium sp. PCR01-08-3 TaxID=3052086 RepID=UPI00255CC985|nr:CbiX/SirB N-terminal domain-containing protein [Propionimicrobium sp. PCR01-08-3]WIY82193.1 CbiX/SirB N-terminal domain-containing protein [Propionimicrobium sp. PCR01-08-3]